MEVVLTLGQAVVFGASTDCDVLLPCPARPIEATLWPFLGFVVVGSGESRRSVMAGCDFEFKAGPPFRYELDYDQVDFLTAARPDYAAACAVQHDEHFMALLRSLAEHSRGEATRGAAPLNDVALLRWLAREVDASVWKSDAPTTEEVSRFRLLIWSAWARVRAEGPLTILLSEKNISEVMLFGDGQCYVERGGRLLAEPSPFARSEDVVALIERIVNRAGRRIDAASPACDCRLPNGTRVHALLPPLAVDGPCLTLRTFHDRLLDGNSLVAQGSLSAQQLLLLEQLARNRRNVVISGGTGTGKTTLLNVLSSAIPAQERVVTIEDCAELRLRRNHVVRLEARPPNLEGRGAVTVRDLVRHALRMRPDRIIVGECRGGEAFDVLQAMNTGHDGSLTTLHANAPEDALRRLETLAMLAGIDLPPSSVREQVASAVHAVIHLTRADDGTRKISRLARVCGLDANGAYRLEDVPAEATSW
jgi:Flp pilus assembly CpaF family ATPase